MLRRSQSPRFFVGIGGQRRGTTKLAVRGLARQFAVRPATAPGLIRHLMGLRRHDDYHYRAYMSVLARGRRIAGEISPS